MQLNKILISLGAEDVRLKNLADNKELTRRAVEGHSRVARETGQAERIGPAARRRFRELISASANPKTGKLPSYLVKVRDGNDEIVHYFHDEKRGPEISRGQSRPESVRRRDRSRNCCRWRRWRRPKTNGGARRRGKLVELHESATIQKIIAELARKGLKVDHYAASDRPIFELIEGEGDKATSHPLFSIPEILQKILEIGRRGVQIKRFKGLGEMNAKELFETTMNPEKRKLLKVDLNDDNAVDADKMFTILMGDVVEPRRQFIEDNALNVRNLDV